MRFPGRGRALRLATAIAVLTALSCGGRASKPARRSAPVHLLLPALDGGEISIAGYRGRVVVVHAFATWSMASQADVEQLSAAYEAHRDDVVVIGLALDPAGYRLVAPWRQAMRARYLIAVATDAVRRGQSPLGRIVEVPTTLILARDGTVAERISGPLRPGQLRELLADFVGGR